MVAVVFNAAYDWTTAQPLVAYMTKARTDFMDEATETIPNSQVRTVKSTISLATFDHFLLTIHKHSFTD